MPTSKGYVPLSDRNVGVDDDAVVVFFVVGEETGGVGTVDLLSGQ